MAKFEVFEEIINAPGGATTSWPRHIGCNAKDTWDALPAVR